MKDFQIQPAKKRLTVFSRMSSQAISMKLDNIFLDKQIAQQTSKEKIIQILKLQCSDNMLSHELQSDGTYIKVKKEASDKSINNHKFLEDYVNRISKATKKMSAQETQQIAARLFMES